MQMKCLDGIRWLEGVAAALASLHSATPSAIVHRDLKSQNVLLFDGAGDFFFESIFFVYIFLKMLL